MIEFYSDNNFKLTKTSVIQDWIASVIDAEGYELGDISFIFCDDDFLLELNQEFLKHDTLTDILSFDYSLGRELHGEIYISTERVAENAKDRQIAFEDELHRVLVHGILHYCGHMDKSPEDRLAMRNAEDMYLAQRIGLK